MHAGDQMCMDVGDLQENAHVFFFKYVCDLL